MTNSVNRADVSDFVQRTIVRLVADRQDLDFEDVRAKIAPTTNLLGEEDGAPVLDSLDVLDLISAIEKEYSLSLPADIDVRSVSTVQDIVDLTERTLNAQ